MIINSVTLDNFKSHKHSHIELNEGISLILGSNGAGKSSIFEAISYSFFKSFDGTIDKIIRKPIDENDIVNEMKVTVEFEKDGTHYKLIRGKKKSTNIAKLYIKKNDSFSPLCNGDKVVTAEIESRLGLESKSFKNAVYIKQGEITELIDKPPAEKKEFIAKLLNIDSLETAQLELKTIIDKYEKEESENAGKLSHKESYEKDKEELNNTILENQNELNKIIPERDKIKKELDSLSEKVKESENKKNEYDSLKSVIEQQEKMVSNCEKQKKKNEESLQNIEELEKENIELEKYTKQLPFLKELKDYEAEIKTYTIELKNINSTLDSINKNKKSLEENEKFYLEYEKINKELESLSNERKTLEEKVNKNQEINIELRNKNNRKDDIRDYIRKISEFASKLFKKTFTNPEEVEKEVLEQKEKTEEYKKILEDKILENNGELISKRNELKTTKKSLNDLENTKDTCPICQSPISHEKHEELSNKYAEDIISLELRIEELTNANKNQNDKVKEAENYLKEIEQINISKLKEQYCEFKKLIEEIKELNKLIPQVEEDNKALETVDNKINERKKYQKDIENKRNSYIVASENLNNTDIEKIESDKKEVDSKIRGIKEKCTAIMRKYNIGDDLDKTLEYTERKVDKYKKNQGIIEGKNNILKENEEVINNFNREQSRLKEFNDKINNLNYDEEYYKKIHETYTSQEDKFENIKISITKLNVEIDKDKESLERKKKELEELEEVSKEQKHLKDYIKLLNEIRELYSKNGVQKDLIDAAIPAIEKHTLDIFNDFDFDYSGLKINSGYDITVLNKNEELDLDMMSGGEKIVIALALRLGIARVVSKNRTELLLLDEPTIHLDAERRDRLIEIISYTSIVPQMIIVTHDDGMEALSNNIIKIKKENGISFVDNS